MKSKHYKNILHYLKLTEQHIGIMVSAAPFEKRKIKSMTIVNIPVYMATKANIIKNALP